MDEKLARLDELLFKLYVSGEMESEKGKKSLERKARALELDDETFRSFVAKRLDKYSQAEDFLNDECTKNPVPQETAEEYYELCVDLEIPKAGAEQLLERKLATVPRELTAAEKKKAAQEELLHGKKHYEIPEVGISFDASLHETTKCLYYYFRTYRTGGLKKLRDNLLAIDSASKITPDYFMAAALDALAPCVNFAKLVRKIGSGDDISDAQVLSVTEFPQQMTEYGRRAQRVWEEFSIAMQQCHETGGDSSMIAIGSLGFMAAAYAAKGITSALGAIGRGIRNARFDSEQESRFLTRFYDECESRIIDECDDALIAIYDKFIGTYSEDFYMDVCRKGELTEPDKFIPLHQRFAAGESGEKIRQDYAEFINRNPWLPDAWADFAELHTFGSTESFHILQTASHLNKAMAYFLQEANRKDFIVCQIHNNTLPPAWHEHIKKMSVPDASAVCLNFVNLRKALAQNETDDADQIAARLRESAESREELEALHAIFMISHLSAPDALRRAMIGHLFCFAPLADKEFEVVQDENAQKKLIQMREKVEKYISQQDFSLYEKGETAVDELDKLFGVFELEAEKQWDAAWGELTKEPCVNLSKPMLLWHQTACALLAGNPSFVAALEPYADLAEGARQWLAEYEKKSFAVSDQKRVSGFFAFARDLWASGIGKQIEKQIPSKKKNSIVAHVIAAAAFVAGNQPDKLNECIAGIRDPDFRYAESLGGLYEFLVSEGKESTALARFLTDFPDIEEKDIALILGPGNGKALAVVMAGCRTVSRDLDAFDKSLLAGIMHHQPQPFSTRYAIFSKYLELRAAENAHDWKNAEKISESLLSVKQYGPYFEIAKLYFDIMAAPENKTLLRTALENGMTLDTLQQCWPHGNWEKLFAETHRSLMAKHRAVLGNTGIIDLAEQLFQRSFSRKYSLCHADDARISNVILPEINKALKQSCGAVLQPEDVLASFRSTQSDGVITPWGMIVYYKSTGKIKHTCWINAVKADRCWGATLKIVMRDGSGDETSLEAFSYDPIDELVKLCDYMISFWSDIGDDRIKEILNGKFYADPGSWISLFAGARSRIRLFEIAEFEEGEIARISRETAAKTKENLEKQVGSFQNPSAPPEKNESVPAGDTSAPRKITKTAASAFFTEVHDPKIMIFPDIPREKMEAAVKGFGIDIDPADIVVLVDNTVSGIADEGMIVTLDAMYSKSQFETAETILFDDCKTLHIEYKKRFLLGYAVEINGKPFASLQIPNAVPELLRGIGSYVTELRNPAPAKSSASSNTEKDASGNTGKENASAVSADGEQKTQEEKPASPACRNPGEPYTVEVLSAGDSKMNLINALRSITSMGLAEAKNFAEHLPQILFSGMTAEAALKNKTILESAGVAVAIHPPVAENAPSNASAKTESVPASASVAEPAENQGDDAQDNFMDLFSAIKDDHIFVVPNIPTKKLNNAMASYAPGIAPGEVLVLVDDTVWGGAKEGIIITKKKLFSKALMEQPMATALSPDTEISVNGKVITIDGRKISLDMTEKASLPKLAEAILVMCKK